MKTLGLIGGISWHSTVEYYRLINQQVAARLGGMHSARVLLHSVDFPEFQPPAGADGWTRLAERFADIAESLERGGAEALVLCANTAHLMADTIERRLRIPLIHIADATARAAGSAGTIGLLGTRFTMEQPFFKERLERAGIRVVIPRDDERDYIHHTIFSELTHGNFSAATRDRYAGIIDGLVAAGAQGIVLGCTEIPLLLGNAADSPVPLFDTTAIHAKAAVDFALAS